MSEPTREEMIAYAEEVRSWGGLAWVPEDPQYPPTAKIGEGIYLHIADVMHATRILRLRALCGDISPSDRLLACILEQAKLVK